ncbi:response regulator transcription factor [Chloroflexota bacterium]
MPKEQESILVVDDEETVRKLLQRILEESGHSVITASNGHEALEKLSQQKIKLVLLDIKMPGLDGFSVLKRLRETSNVPVIMLTATKEPNTVADALSLGADDYVRKPFKQGELLARINTKLKRTVTDP